MKRKAPGLVLIIVSILLLLLPSAVFGGCRGAEDQRNGASGENRESAHAEGLSRGMADGYTQGLEDGKTERYSPQVPQVPGNDEDFVRGYTEGWTEGYEEGYRRGKEEADSGEKNELAEVEAAMIAFVKQNAAPGLEFRIDNLVINGNEAVGRAACTSERLESPYVVMKKGVSGWYGVDFGTGIEPPGWYPH